MAKADRDAVLRARKRVPPPGGALLEDTEKMKQKHHRMLCALCALVILVSTVFPTAAFAEQPVDAAAAEQTLTRADAAGMQQADAAVTALTESEQYQEMDTDARKDAAALLRRTENQAVEKFGTAVIYYAFDNTINSSRFPYYAYMQGFWSALGLETKINIHVTVADLKKMGNYNVSVLSAHGSYYTYSYGKFLKRTRTEPIMLLTEESTFGKDLRYGFDLLAHRVIKVNGMYCVTSDFFRNAYKGGKLSNTIVYSETCEFLGVDGSEDNAMADALLSGGAQAVIGYVNNVYTVYSRSMLWDTINHLIMGQNVGQALEHAKATYGEDDLIWYHAQGGRRPHAAASYAVLYGNSQAALNVPESNRSMFSADLAA